ncbi:hypothetical protein [Thermococcus stetteri]|uniref:hypothetical protein n=1 Tax=Thermococcus stetteri TaxID=49900 RepID=UPI001AE7BD4C|nr:hypothetical protein [Thermococcus stetteri]MBP1911589.1 hypothetical protein [Thermococcus stetteri]
MGEVIRAFRKSRVLSLGLFMVVLALVLSAVASFVVEDKSYSQSGELGPGEYALGNESFESKYLYPNRTLVLTSDNATLLVSSGENRSYNLRGKIVLHPEGKPNVVVYNGSVSYTYSVKALNYPYSDLSIPALILALVGSVFLWVGYAKALRDVREEGKNEKA